MNIKQLIEQEERYQEQLNAVVIWPGTKREYEEHIGSACVVADTGERVKGVSFSQLSTYDCPVAHKVYGDRQVYQHTRSPLEYGPDTDADDIPDVKLYRVRTKLKRRLLDQGLVAIVHAVDEDDVGLPLARVGGNGGAGPYR